MPESDPDRIPSSQTAATGVLAWPRWARLALVASSSVWMALGAPPGGWTELIWLGFIPFFLILEDPRLGLREAGFCGWLSGLGVGLIGFPWIGQMLVNFAGVPGPIGLLGVFGLAAWMAIPFGLLGVLVAWLAASDGPGWQRWLLPITGFAGLQYVWPALFPYTPVIGFAEQPEWMQLAEIGGAHLVEAQVVLVGRLAAEAIRRPGLAARLVLGGSALAIPLLSYWGGAYRMATIDGELAGADAIRVALIQPNTPIGFRDAPEALRRLRDGSRRAQDAGAELVVWPEAGTYPYTLARPVLEEPRSERARILATHSIPTLFGAASRETGDRYGYNSFYALDPEGQIVGRYDKVIRVPFGEYIPLVDPEWLSRIAPSVSHRHAGTGPRTWSIDLPDRSAPLRIGPLICYEDILAGYTLRVAKLGEGVDLFVNATIDAWYGPDKEPWEHLALAQFRSVEHRVPLVRAVSTGVSAYVDATGRLTAHLSSSPVTLARVDEFPEEVLVVDVPIARSTVGRPTVFARGGWLFPGSCLALTFILVGARARSLRAT